MATFPGLMEDVDPHDLPPGAAEIQVNLVCTRMGQMDVRAGLREVAFDS